MIFRIEVRPRDATQDPHASRILRESRLHTDLKAVEMSRLYAKLSKNVSGIRNMS